MHAEIEGIICQDFLKAFIEVLKRKKIAFLRLDDIAKETFSKKETIYKSKIVNGRIKGRVGFVTCQL